MLGLIAVIGLIACADQQAESPEPEDIPNLSEAPWHSREIRLHDEGPSFTFLIFGDAFDTNVNINRIEIIATNEPSSKQVIKGLESESPIDGNGHVLEFVDVNFDGYLDFRFVEFLPAGANVPYLNWVFDEQTAQFVRAESLNELAAPVFNAEQQTVQSSWRDGPQQYITEVYVWRNNALAPSSRLVREFIDSGRYVQSESVFSDGDWLVTSKQTIEESVEKPIERDLEK